MQEQEFPFPIDAEAMLSTLATLFAAEGKAREVAVIANANAEFVYTGYDSWNGGTNEFNLNLFVPASLFALALSESDNLLECKSNIQQKASEVIEYLNQYVIRHIHITPALTVEEKWRDKAHTWLSGKGVSNQGRVRSDNVASRNCDGLLFRSQPEINVYQAFKNLGVPFAPLPVFVKGGTSYRRIEPDFIIIKDGVTVMLEVDGDTVHHETPAEAHDRTTMLAHEGVHVERVKASDCATIEAAMLCAKKILAIMEKVKLRK